MGAVEATAWEMCCGKQLVGKMDVFREDASMYINVISSHVLTNTAKLMQTAQGI